MVDEKDVKTVVSSVDSKVAMWAALTDASMAVHSAVLLGAKGVVMMVASRAVMKVFCWVEHSVSSSVAAMVDQLVVV